VVTPRHRLGSTSLEVTSLCVGGAPLGSMPGNFGYEVDVERATATVRHVFDSPVNFLDTSNGYSGGESERRIGSVIAERGGLPEGFVLSTKVDRDSASGDFSAERVRRSAEESLTRLGLDRFQLLFLHDPENVGFEAATASGGAVDGLLALKEEGIAEHIGVAGGPIGMMREFVRTGAFEVILTHNRFSLVDRSAEELIEEADAAGLGILNAAVYGGGILARGSSSTNRYAYKPASERVLRAIHEIEDLCAETGVPLRAAALLFSLNDPRISSTVFGSATPEHLDELLALQSQTVPDDFWKRLDRMVPPRSEWLY
jgi:D-threo-aldose 1-dehydrogenase